MYENTYMGEREKLLQSTIRVLCTYFHSFNPTLVVHTQCVYVHVRMCLSLFTSAPARPYMCASMYALYIRFYFIYCISFALSHLFTLFDSCFVCVPFVNGLSLGVYVFFANAFLLCTDNAQCARFDIFCSTHIDTRTKSFWKQRRAPEQLLWRRTINRRMHRANPIHLNIQWKSEK